MCYNFLITKSLISMKGEKFRMFFESWWQGIVFGFFTTVAMLVIAHAFTVMWKKYEDVPEKKPVCHDDHHH